MAFITDNDLKTKLAANLKVADASQLPAGWTQIITDSNAAAYANIVGVLSARGYTGAQIASWDRGAEFNSDLGLFWCLVKGAGLHGNDATFIDKLDRRKELEDVAIMNGGVLVTPDTGGAVGYGQFDTTDDAFTRKTTW